MSDGWEITGTIAELISLLAIALAVFEIVVRRRRIAVALLIHAWAVAGGPNGERWVVVDIVNAGGEIAVMESLQIVNGTLVPNPNFPVNPSIAAGGTTRIWVDAPDVLEVWFRFVWVTPKDQRFMFAAWRPMISGEESIVARQWLPSNLRKPRRTVFNLWFFDRWPQPVAPEHHAFGRIRTTWREKAQLARRQRLLPEIDGQPPQWRLGLMDPRQHTH